MIITIEFIGSLQKLVNAKKYSIELEEGASLSILMQEIKKKFPENKSLPDEASFLVMNNGREINVLQGFQTILRNNDYVTLIPISHGG